MNDQFDKYEKKAKGRIRTWAEDRPLTYTGIALAVGFILGAIIL